MTNQTYPELTLNGQYAHYQTTSILLSVYDNELPVLLSKREMTHAIFQLLQISRRIAILHQLSGIQNGSRRSLREIALHGVEISRFHYHCKTLLIPESLLIRPCQTQMNQKKNKLQTKSWHNQRRNGRNRTSSSFELN